MFPIYLKYEDLGTKISLELNSMQTFITGNSATGKTFISNKLASMKKNPSLRKDVVCNFDWNKLYVCSSKEEAYALFDVKDSMIIFDRLDNYYDAKILEFVRSGKNIVILISRYGFDDVYTTGDNMKVLKSARVDDKICIQTLNALSPEARRMELEI